MEMLRLMDRQLAIETALTARLEVEHCCRLRCVLESVYGRLTGSSDRALAEIRSDLDSDLRLAGSNHLDVIHDAIASVVESLQLIETLAGSTAGGIHGADGQGVLDACDELRLHLVATFFSDDVEGRSSDVVQTVEHTAGGLAYTTVADTSIVVLPQVVDEAECHAVYEDFLSIAALDGGNHHWALDFSTVSELPVLLLANVIAHAWRMRQTDGKVSLCWLRRDLVSDEQYLRLNRFFNLREIDGYLFSNL